MTGGLFGLPIAVASRWIFNSYAVRSPEGTVAVVDPGLPSVAEAVLDAIADQLALDPRDVRTVVCTHGHSDHVGGVSTLLDGCDAGTEVHLPQRCEAYLAGETPRLFPLVESSLRFMPVYREQPFSAGALREFLAGTSKVGFGGRPQMTVDFDPAGFLGEGAPVPSLPGWVTLSTPGHSDDSTCFYHADSATLISGDTVVTQDGTAWFNPEYVDLELAGETADRLLSLEVRHLLPGHGPPIEARDVWAGREAPDGPPHGCVAARPLLAPPRTLGALTGSRDPWGAALRSRCARHRHRPRHSTRDADST
ncbi:MAG: MBL fold metallo-hydrolase [Microthrixaceae bacterium]|nr:MBL fold metallo-hydrolase [Microthrixaceae bacterium]